MASKSSWSFSNETRATAGRTWTFGRPVAPVIWGIVTAIGGGLIRDVLAGRQNLLMQRELIAVPILFGCALFVMLLEFLPGTEFVVGVVCGFRCAAIHWELTIPELLAPHTKHDTKQKRSKR